MKSRACAGNVLLIDLALTLRLAVVAFVDLPASIFSLPSGAGNPAGRLVRSGGFSSVVAWVRAAYFRQIFLHATIASSHACDVRPLAMTGAACHLGRALESDALWAHQLRTDCVVIRAWSALPLAGSDVTFLAKS